MPKPRLLISVSGGAVQDVFTNVPNLEVILCDWDVDGPSGDDLPQIVHFEHSGRHQSALVTPFQAAALPPSPDSPLATALQLAGYGERDNHQLCERELATVLAALRYWQGDLVEGDPSYGHHFQECPPLSSD